MSGEEKDGVDGVDEEEKDEVDGVDEEENDKGDEDGDNDVTASTNPG